MLIIVALFSYAIYDVVRQVEMGDATAIDGDTLKVHERRIRLIGIDAPEMRQTCGALKNEWQCGERAHTELTQLIYGRAVFCLLRGQDRYQRSLGLCYAGFFDDVAEHMVKQGLAITYGSRGVRYASQQDVALQNMKGIWRTSFIPPERWREERG